MPKYMSLIWTSLAIALVLNLIVFLVAYEKQTDKLTDITYALTFIIIALYSWWAGEDDNGVYKITLLFMVLIWAVRLGSYLFVRVNIKGKDHRFDAFRNKFRRYLRFWILQGISIWIVSLPFIMGLSKSIAEINEIRGNFIVTLGMAVWIAGFLLESIADRQKFRFRLNPANEGKFMNRGLFNVIRYPNYLGEMLIWIGVFMSVIPLLRGLEWLSIISPLWICILLIFLSGIPFLERSNEKRYAHLKEFQIYKERTSKLIPFIY